MKTEVISTQDERAIPRALEVLRKGGLIAFPTDTVYGVAADVWSYPGIERLYLAKGREAAKAIPVLVGDLAQLDRISPEMGLCARRLARRFWPGALTLVIPRSPDLPAPLSPTPTVGVRMPDHPFTLALLRASGPLATTSANLSGGPNPMNAQDVLAQLDDRIELVLDGGPVPGGMPSTVVDCTASRPAVLRAGPLSEAELWQALEGDEA